MLQSRATPLFVVASVLGAACGGQVNGAGDHAIIPDDGGIEAAPVESGTPSEGGTPEGGTSGDGGVPTDAQVQGDGWSDDPATQSSGPPPACATPALACGAAFPGATAFATSQDVANALVGKWSFCGQSSSGFYPPGQLGEEYVADGTYYQLIAGTSGQLQRNLNPTAISKWQVVLMSDGSIEIHTGNTGGIQRGGGLSACPPSLVLLDVEARTP